MHVESLDALIMEFQAADDRRIAGSAQPLAAQREATGFTLTYEIENYVLDLAPI